MGGFFCSSPPACQIRLQEKKKDVVLLLLSGLPSERHRVKEFSFSEVNSKHSSLWLATDEN